MFIELVDAFRCLAPHEDSWLVLAADRMLDRRVIDGTLGCPICRATYPIRAGEARFDGGAEQGSAAASTAESGAPTPGEDEVMRLAALLDLTEPGARVLLVGAWGALAPALVHLVPVECLLLDPPAGVRPAEGVSIVRGGGRLPLAAGAVRCAALDELAPPALVEAVVRAVRGGGRVVGPVGTPLPAGVKELARDDRHWVADREAPASAPVQLRLVRRGEE